jgi:hypothetical protein
LYSARILIGTITYEEFDEYYAEAITLMNLLLEIAESCEPANEGIKFVRDIAKIAAASDNVVVFKKPRS